MNEAEWETREHRIDRRLRSLNPEWTIVRYTSGLDLSALRCCAVEEFPTANGPADCALFVNGLFLGILEAKKLKWDVAPKQDPSNPKAFCRSGTGYGALMQEFEGPRGTDLRYVVLGSRTLRRDRVAPTGSRLYRRLVTGGPPPA